MGREASQKKEEKQVLPIEELESRYRDLQAKYEELRRTSSLHDAEMKKWKDASDEFDDFYDNAPCGYHTLDENGLIIKMNRTELDWLGYTAAEVVGKRYMADMFSDKGVVNYYKYQSEVKTKGDTQFEGEYVRKDGTTYERAVKVKGIFDTDGKFNGVRVTLWDITDRKNMEEEMLKVNRQFRDIKDRVEEKNEVLEKMNRELDMLKKEKVGLIRIITNKLQVPLNRISSLCDELLNATGLSMAMQWETVHKINEEVNSLSRCVNDYEVRQRMATDSGYLQVSEFSLSHLLVAVADRFEDMARQQQLTLTYEVFADFSIRSDQGYLTQIIDKLLSNAISSCQRGKEIALKLLKETDRYLIELEIKEPARKISEIVTLTADKKTEIVAGTAVPNWDLSLADALANKLGCKLVVSSKDDNNIIIRLFVPAA